MTCGPQPSHLQVKEVLLLAETQLLETTHLAGCHGFARSVRSGGSGSPCNAHGTWAGKRLPRRTLPASQSHFRNVCQVWHPTSKLLCLQYNHCTEGYDFSQSRGISQEGSHMPESTCCVSKLGGFVHLCCLICHLTWKISRSHMQEAINILLLLVQDA